jgi:hypothetical protein
MRAKRAHRGLAVGLLVLAACGGSSAPEARPAGDVDPAAFTGSASTVTGDDVELAAFADRDLVVWFWAPW